MRDEHPLLQARTLFQGRAELQQLQLQTPAAAPLSNVLGCLCLPYKPVVSSHLPARQEKQQPLNISMYKVSFAGGVCRAGKDLHAVNSCLPARGHGAKGDNIYEFEIEFLEPVEPKVGICALLTK